MEFIRKPDNWWQICKKKQVQLFYIKWCVSLKHVEKKKLLGCHSCLIAEEPSEKFWKKAVLKSFAIFTGKHLC